MRVRIFIVEDHALVQLGWKRLLDPTQFEIVGQASSIEETVREIGSSSADVVLLDVRLSDGIAFRNLREHRALVKAQPVVVVTAFDNPTYIAQAVAIGAVDAHTKDEPKAQIEEAIRSAAQQQGPTGSRFIAVQSFLHDRTRLTQHGLSRRETQVLRHLFYGLSNQEIASSLGITEDTVKEHVHNVYRKLDIKDRAAAGVWAVNHLLKSPCS